MVIAHLAHDLVEPLIFMPAFAATGWAVWRSYRDRHRKDDQ